MHCLPFLQCRFPFLRIQVFTIRCCDVNDRNFDELATVPGEWTSLVRTVSALAYWPTGGALGTRTLCSRNRQKTLALSRRRLCAIVNSQRLTAQRYAKTLLCREISNRGGEATGTWMNECAPSLTDEEMSALFESPALTATSIKGNAIYEAAEYVSAPQYREPLSRMAASPPQSGWRNWSTLLQLIRALAGVTRTQCHV